MRVDVLNYLVQSTITQRPETVTCSIFGVGSCEGEILVTNACCPDRDGDNYQDKACGGSDCNDNPATGFYINPGATEYCDDGIDNDSDGDVDLEYTAFICEYLLEGFWDPYLCWCWTATPILIDTSGNGFDLTDAPGGVNFDIDGNGTSERLGWTVAGSDDAFLALDRNGNGLIDDGTELFGNFTPQSYSTDPNGFIALAEFDKVENGGNSDGRVGAGDAIFSSLRLWQDVNHDGISEPGELWWLPSMGVVSINLDYRESRRRDEHGNWFRYRARVYDSRGAHLGRWAWDVYLVFQL